MMQNKVLLFLLRRSSSIPECTMKDLRNITILLFIASLILVQFRRSVSHGQEKLLVIAAKEPTRFFPHGSPVKDYFLGNASGLGLAAMSNDLTFVFLYAPWCLFSQNARSEFETVARMFHNNQAAFVAVNCAWHAGTCARHKRPEHFPVIGAYVGRNQRYFIAFRGVPIALHLEIFVRRLLQPYRLIARKEDFDEFIHTHDIAVIAASQITGTRISKGLQVFYNISLLISRQDSRGTVGLGLIADYTFARKLGLVHTDSLHIFRLGKEVRSFLHLSHISDSFIDGLVVQQQKTLPFKWIFPTFQKSFALSNVLHNNATMIFFTPYQPDSRKLSPMISLIHRIAAMYADCDRSTDSIRLIVADREERLKRKETNLQEEERCRHLQKQFGYLLDINLRTSMSRKQNCICLPEVNSSASSHDICWMKSPFRVTSVPVLSSGSFPVSCPVQKGCSNGLSHNRIFSSCCYPARIHAQTRDNQRTMAQLEACRNAPYRLLNKIEIEPVWQTGDAFTDRLEAIHGLKCSTNKSLEFLAIDPILYPHFLELVGASSIKPSLLKMMIVDKEVSEKYIHHGDLTPAIIADFIVNFTNGQLVAHRRSAAPSSPKLDLPLKRKQELVSMKELTSQTFSSMLDSEQDDVVVLYYTPWCTFCKSVHSALYNLAGIFRNVSGLSFRRINVHDNSLPWENRISFVPAIQIFPSLRKRDNVATFPSSSILNLLNLLKFTLLHVSPQVWRGFVSSRCSEECWHINRLKAKRLLRVLRKEVKILRRAFFFAAFCDVSKVNWRITRSRSKARFLSAILSADSVDGFIKDVLSQKSNSMDFEEHSYLRMFFTEFVV